MKKRIIIFSILALLLPHLSYSASSLGQQLKGKIILQVESHGEAWYVNPSDYKRIYLKDGATAYSMMRNLSLGITDANLKKIPVGVETRFEDIDTDSDGLSDNLEEGLKTDPYSSDSDGDGVDDGAEVLVNNYDPLGAGKLVYDYSLINSLKGKILLQVESRGEAWYINPVDGKRYYMKDGNAAYQIMRFLSLGITNANLLNIQVSDISLESNSIQEPAVPENPPVQEEASEPIAENNPASAISAPALVSELTNSQIIQKVKPAVAYLETLEGSGTGFIIEADGYIVTNAHVVGEALNLTAKLYDGSSYVAQVVASNEILDIALLKISQSGLTTVELDDSDEVMQGDEVFAFGYPFGIEGDVSFNNGTISRETNIDDINYFETSVDIHPGNSGGPLVDKYGKVIGVNTSGYGYNIGGVAIGETIKFALPINLVSEALPDLKSGISVSNEVEHISVETVPLTYSSSLVDIGVTTVMMKLKFTSTYAEDKTVSGITFKMQGLFNGMEFDDCSIKNGGIILGTGNIIDDEIIFHNMPLIIPANSSQEISLVVEVAYDITNYLHSITLVIEDSASFVAQGIIESDFPIESRSIIIMY